MESNASTKGGTQDLILFLFKKRKILILTTLVAFVVGIVISLLMTVLFQSTAIVFPTATSTVSFSEQRKAKANAMDFGEEEQAEQMIQILQSSKIRNRIVSHFDLWKVYEIEPDEANRNYKLGQAYEQHISFERTRYGSIKIDVLDEEPQRAANIANKIVQLIDTVKNALIKERTVPAFDVNKRKIDKLNQDQQNLIAEMDSLSAMGVVGPEARANLFSAVNEAKRPEDRIFFKQQIEVNLKYGARYDALADLREFRLEKLTDQEVSYEQAESDAVENFNHKFVVEYAVPSDKKAKPKRSIVVILFTFGALFLTIFYLLIAEKVKELRKKA